LIVTLISEEIDLKVNNTNKGKSLIETDLGD